MAFVFSSMFNNCAAAEPNRLLAKVKSWIMHPEYKTSGAVRSTHQKLFIRDALFCLFWYSVRHVLWQPLRLDGDRPVRPQARELHSAVQRQAAGAGHPRRGNGEERPRRRIQHCRRCDLNFYFYSHWKKYSVGDVMLQHFSPPCIGNIFSF